MKSDITSIKSEISEFKNLLKELIQNKQQNINNNKTINNKKLYNNLINKNKNNNYKK